MAVEVTVPYERSFTVNRPLAEAFTHLSDVESSIPKHFYGISEFKRLEDTSYHWIFQKLEYSSYSFQLSLKTRFEFKPSEHILMHAIPSKDDPCLLKGSWVFKDQGTGTQIVFVAEFKVSLPVPFLLKSMVTSLTQKEITKLLDRYVQHLIKTLA